MDALNPRSEDDEDLRLLVESAAGIAPRDGDLKTVRRLRFSKPGIDRARWSDIAAMGWLSLRLPEAQGGAGLGMAAYAGLCGELGAALLPEPVIEAGLALDLMGEAAEPEVLAGRRLVLPAWMDGPDGLGPVGGIVEGDGGITGERLFVPMAAAADAFLVVTSGACFLVEAEAPGLTLTCEDTLDGGHVGRLVLHGVPARRLPAPSALPFEAAALATSAALFGLMERTFAATLDYLKTRVQFGQPIGHFQALQHRAVDLRIEIGLTQATLRDAAAAMDAGGDSRALVSRAKARAATAALAVTREAVQMHGAIGYTDEADIGLFLRRAMVLAPRYGSAAFHRARYAALPGSAS
jgi:alkylation response protein AidB-like acyl-CoA dehydrogenase